MDTLPSFPYKTAAVAVS